MSAKLKVKRGKTNSWKYDIGEPIDLGNSFNTSLSEENSPNAYVTQVSAGVYRVVGKTGGSFWGGNLFQSTFTIPEGTYFFEVSGTDKNINWMFNNDFATSVKSAIKEVTASTSVNVYIPSTGPVYSDFSYDFELKLCKCIPSTKTLEAGQLGAEYTESGYTRLKVGPDNGDGSATLWKDIPYACPPADIYTDTGISTTGNYSIKAYAQKPTDGSTNKSQITLEPSNYGPSGEKIGRLHIGYDSSSYLTGLYLATLGNLLLDPTDNVVCSSNLVPQGSSATGYSLGTSNHSWASIYATNGTIQTSARSEKENIKNVVSEHTPMTMSLNREPVEISDITQEMIVDFVSNLQPVTFNYKQDGDITQESVQLGLIADDIAEHDIYKYIGIDQTEIVEIEPAEYDEGGNVIKEAVTEEKRSLGLQTLPLVVAALTTCKQLINEVDILKARLDELESNA